MKNEAAKTRRLSVYFFVPNLVGYARIVLTILAFSNWRDYVRFNWFYFTGFLLDGVDGFTARAFNQSSEFGALLDMLTDRCASAALLAVLSHLYPTYAAIFMILIFLDGYSHWMGMGAALCSGNKSHKTGNQSKLLQLYYSRPVLTFFCLFNEIFFLVLYTMYFTTGPVVSLFGYELPLLKALAVFSAPIFFLKQLVNVRQVSTLHSVMMDNPMAGGAL